MAPYANLLHCALYSIIYLPLQDSKGSMQLTIGHTDHICRACHVKSSVPVEVIFPELL